MTTLQLAHSLARHLRNRDIATMSATAKLDILQAINAALQRLYAVMPAIHKRTTITAMLRAPVDVSFDIPERYTNTLTSSSFSEAMRGCTVFLGDDANPNEVVEPNAVLDEYVGNALSGTAKVHFDALPIYDVIERIVSEPLITQAGQTPVKLIRQQEGFDRLPKTTGAPRRYNLIPLGSSQGASPEFYLRVWPMPDTDYKIRFDVELSTARVTFLQIAQTPVDLPVNDRIAESVLLPIAREELMSSPDWTTSKDGISEKAAKALSLLGTMMPRDMAPAFNRVGTPANY